MAVYGFAVYGEDVDSIRSLRRKPDTAVECVLSPSTKPILVGFAFYGEWGQRVSLGKGLEHSKEAQQAWSRLSKSRSPLEAARSLSKLFGWREHSKDVVGEHSKVLWLESTAK